VKCPAIHRDLKRVLEEIQKEASPDRDNVLFARLSNETILKNTRGKQWSPNGFKASWQHELNRSAMSSLREAKLVFHGLRKSAVVFLLEAGCSDAEVSAITGQSREMVAHYAKQVNQKKLAAAAILKWEAAGKAR